ncbi:MAG: peptidoglycan DL-endopeptidase CwlO [Actinomycetota bacterium]|jgi:cell wall-associated NlpC family hydrolase|nr:peptidoglycan DL-endopeptidase CwlO [Actinomycetota bacterium]
MRRFLSLFVLSCCVLSWVAVPVAHAGRERPPEWVRPALKYLVDQGYFSREGFEADEPMARRVFKRLMSNAFEGGYRRTKGFVTAGEVGASLVRKLGFTELATSLSDVRSPDGWDPDLSKRFGTEVVARELGLRHDRPTNEEMHEAAEAQPITQGDAVWAVWQAKTSPDEWAAEALTSFSLGDYGGMRQRVVKFALSLVGTPYVWGGEWLTETADGYPYGAQPKGGVDCSGFAWYVLQAKSDNYQPVDRSYKGWSIPERSSAEMAKAAPKRLRIKEMQAGDILFFAPEGRDAKATDVYHAGIYLGEGWMIHSSGSRDGISLASVGPGSWWRDQIFGGRKVITR